MAILSSLLAVSQPKGFWVTIIKAFEALTNNYVLAIILITLIIRLVWSFLELGMKYNQQHMAKINAKMQPELDKLKEKYANQPQVFQAKQNELYQKHYGKSQIGSCLIMIITTAINLVIFFTLLSGLNAISSYKNSVSYDSIKYTYVNCLEVTDKYLTDENVAEYGSYEDRLDYFADYENLSFVFRTEKEGDEKVTYVDIVYNESIGDTTYQRLLYTTKYKTDFSEEVTVPAENPGEEDTTKIITTNEYIIDNLIEFYFPVYEKGEEFGSREKIIGVDENGKDIYLSTAIQSVAMKNVVEVYDQSKESFLWIKNIWIADSPMNKSIVSYNTLANQIGKKNLEEGEEKIYNAFMPDLKEERNEVNGYFIIPILLVLTAVLSMQVTNMYTKRKNAKKGLPEAKQNAGWVKIIIPIMLGMFGLFYNSVFAIYLLVGQIVSLAVSVPQLMLIDYIIDKKEEKQKEKNTVTVDYSRKF